MLTQFDKSKKIPNFKKAKSKVLDALRLKDYKYLFSWLEQYYPTKELKDNFFSREGHFILRYILSYSDDLNILKLIRDRFSKISIKSALKNDKYDAIRGFFITQHGAELFDHDDESHRIIRIAKFKFLLQISEKLIKTFITSNEDASYITFKIKEDFNKAEKEFLSDKYDPKILFKNAYI